jgi:hypothetical protein
LHAVPLKTSRPCLMSASVQGVEGHISLSQPSTPGTTDEAEREPTRPWMLRHVPRPEERRGAREPTHAL